MFAPLIAKGRANAAPSKTSAPQHSLPVKHPPSNLAERALVLQRTVGNQALSRLFEHQTRTHEQESVPAGQKPLSGPSLAVGSVSDPLEREADAVAEKVMRMPDPSPVVRSASSSTGPQLQRECSCGGSCDKCQAEQDHEKKLQMKGARSGALGPTEAPPIVHDVLRSPGQPLDSASRAFMEPRFGYDFGSIRIHTDPQAAQSAQAVQARAYTVGDHIVFDTTQSSRESDLTLLAHELSHSIQQGSGTLNLQRKPADKPTPPPKPPAGGNILYIGVNPESFPGEIAALEKLYKRKDVVTKVTAAKNPAEAISKGKTFDLTNDAGADAFAAILGLSKDQTKKAAELLKGQPANARGVMAHVMAVYALTEDDGQDRMSRVVLSGHSAGGIEIRTKPFEIENQILMDELSQLAKIFPKASAQTKHVIVSACYVGAEENVMHFFKKAYPNLVTFSGWTDQCPTEKGAATAVADWAKTTDSDPTSLAKPPKGRSNWASGVYQGDEASSPSETMKNLRADEPKFLDYFNGVKSDPNSHRGWLTNYYGQARQADLRGDIVGPDHDYAHVHAQQAVRLRLWAELTAKFAKDNEAKLRLGYGKTALPAFGTMTRKEALKAIADFPKVAKGEPADQTEAQRLLDGLKNLD
jgi:Domain of unknown function (DUF4157)